MRLREIYQAIKPNIDNLVLDVAHRNDGSYNINGINRVIQAIKNIELTGLFGEAIRIIKGTRLYEGFTDNLVVKDTQLNAINKSLEALKFSTYSLIESLEKANIDLEGSELQISISFPENLNFGELSKYFDKLKKGIELPLAELPEGGSIQIKNFDSGSFWIDVVLPTGASLALIAGLIWAGAVIHNKRLQAKAMNAYVDGLEHQADWLEKIKELGEKQIESYIEAEAKILEKDNFSDSDNERLMRLSLSIKETSELISSGVKMYPSLAAPETAKNLFPNFSTINLIDSKMKRIGDGS